MSLKNEIICRCEELSREEIIEAIRKGYHTVDGIKKKTRAGMGLCQGRSCTRLIQEIIAAELGISIDTLPQGNARSPVEPLTLTQLASGAEKDVINSLDDPFWTHNQNKTE
jgi:NAD(P)H-nitrite reductase large subunit